MDNTQKYRKACDGIARDFIRYIFDREPDFGTLGADHWLCKPGEVLCLDDNYYFDTNLMVEVLENKYRVDDVLMYHDYSVYHSGEEREFYISLPTFIEIREGRSLTDFAEFYHDTVKKERAYWDSPEGKAVNEESLREMKEKYLKDLDTEATKYHGVASNIL